MGTPKKTLRFGRIVGIASNVLRKEPEYRVVFEDGDEACVPESELRLWSADCPQSTGMLNSTSFAAKQGNHLSDMATSTGTEFSRTSTTTSMSPAVNTLPTNLSTTTSAASRSCHDSWYHNGRPRVARNIATVRFDSSCGRRVSQGPMPLRQWQQHSCSGWCSDSTEPSSFAEYLITGMFVLVLSFLAAIGINRLAEFLFRALGLDALLRWVGFASVEAFDLLGVESAWPSVHVDGTSLTSNLPRATL